jgi:hypothetical protein
MELIRTLFPRTPGLLLGVAMGDPFDASALPPWLAAGVSGGEAGASFAAAPELSAPLAAGTISSVYGAVLCEDARIVQAVVEIACVDKPSASALCRALGTELDRLLGQGEELPRKLKKLPTPRCWRAGGEGVLSLEVSPVEQAQVRVAVDRAR